MSDLREAAKLALIALENGTSPNLWVSTKENLRKALAQPDEVLAEREACAKAAEAVLEAWDWDWSEPRNEALRERMEALRKALAQPDEVLAEREACAKVCEDWNTAITDKLAAAIRARSEK